HGVREAATIECDDVEERRRGLERPDPERGADRGRHQQHRECPAAREAEAQSLEQVRHQVMYLRPLPVMKSTTSSSRSSWPASMSCGTAAATAPPSGAANTPVVRPTSRTASVIASSLTAAAAPFDAR